MLQAASGAVGSLAAAENLQPRCENSFSRWVVENLSRLASRASEDRRQVLEDIACCRHLPLNLRDFEDCRERYLEEYAHPLLEDSTDGTALEFRRLMQKWQDSRNA